MRNAGENGVLEQNENTCKIGRSELVALKEWTFWWSSGFQRLVQDWT
jgi:hypothetical protein